MKNYLLIVFMIITAFACNRKDLADSNKERDSLMTELNQRDSSLNDFITYFNDIEQNLNVVSEKQNIISVNSNKAGELNTSQKSRINSEIASINTLMDQNRKKISELNQILKKSSNKNLMLEKMISTLNEQLTRKDNELTELNSKLALLNSEVTTLETSVGMLTILNDEQTQVITDKTTALHTAYYVVGKSKDLQDAKIIDRKGGLLGIGKTSKLSEDFDNSKFTRIDYSQTNNFPVNSDMKIITSHPSSSYTLDTDDKDKDFVKNVVITNSELFWSASKYLVIVKN